MIGYVHVIDPCDCGAYDWAYDYVESGSRKICKQCGNVVETFWETTVFDSEGNNEHPTT